MLWLYLATHDNANIYYLVIIADCGQPTEVPNAYINEGNTLEGSVRTYSCNANTVLDGHPEIRCGVDGKWSPTSFRCQRKFQSEEPMFI